MKDFIASLRGKLFVLRCTIWRRNITIGNGLRMYRRLDIRGEGRIVVGRDFVVDGALGDTRQFVTLYTLNPDATIKLGNRVILYAARISSKFSITIGDDTHIEETGIADTDFHSLDKQRGLPTSEIAERCRVIIGDRVRIGARSLINKGVTIGNDTIVAPGSIVSRSLPSRCFAIGNPARPVSDKSGK